MILICVCPNFSTNNYLYKKVILFMGMEINPLMIHVNILYTLYIHTHIWIKTISVFLPVEKMSLSQITIKFVELDVKWNVAWFIWTTTAVRLLLPSWKNIFRPQKWRGAKLVSYFPVWLEKLWNWIRISLDPFWKFIYCILFETIFLPNI